MHTIIAGIDASNETSLKLHQYFGFEEVAHLERWDTNLIGGLI